jgi:hypothetical protein
VLRFEQMSPGRPEAAWPLLAQPARWPAWAPHIRGAVGLGSPEVQRGRRGVVLVAFVVPVPVRVSAKQDGRSWDWQTGPMTIRHGVEPHESGCRLLIEIEAPRPLESVISVTYGPLIRWVLLRLAALAAEAS